MPMCPCCFEEVSTPNVGIDEYYFDCEHCGETIKVKVMKGGEIYVSKRNEKTDIPTYVSKR